jgi:uracil-DNA glycosylase family 4
MSGKVLDGVLTHLGIDRQAALMTNAAACHYPKEIFKDKLPPEAIEHCRPRLLHELNTVGVNTAVTLGAQALKALIDTKSGITISRAGGPRPSSYLPSMLVVPTYHPAYAMRSHQMFPFIVSDIEKVFDGEWRDRWQPVDFKVIRSELEANHKIMWFWKTHHDPLCLDTESGADKDDTFGGSIRDVLCIGIKDTVNNQVVVFPREVLNDNNRKLLGRLCERNGLDGQNLKYDICRVLNVFLGVDRVLDILMLGDRMLESYALCEAPGIHNLDYMSREYLGSDEWKSWIKESMEEGRRKAKAEAKARGEKIGNRFNGLNYALVDPEILYKYNAYDVENTDRLRSHFEPLLNEVEGLPKFYAWLLEVSQMLIHVEQRGIEVDLDYNAELEREYVAKLGAIEFKGTNPEFNPNSTKQIHAFLKMMNLELPDTRKDTIKNMIARYELTGENDAALSFFKTLLEHRGDKKLMSTYVLGLRKTLINGIAHPDFSLLSATTRLRARRPNSQNTPKGSKIRRQYRARPGKIFVHCDFGQIELRVMAWLAKDEVLRQMFMAPGDIFYDMCCMVYPAYATFSQEKREKCRQLIKTIAYGTAYGRKANSVASAFQITHTEATKIQSNFNSKIPGVVKYQADIRYKALHNEDLVTVFGGRRRFRLVVPTNKVDVENEAMAHMPQATANGICLTAAIEVDKQGLPIVNLVHDQIVTEVDESDAEEAGRLLSKIMVTTAETITDGYVPIKAEAGSGYTFGDLH